MGLLNMAENQWINDKWGYNPAYKGYSSTYSWWGILYLEFRVYWEPSRERVHISLNMRTICKRAPNVINIIWLWSMFVANVTAFVLRLNSVCEISSDLEWDEQNPSLPKSSKSHPRTFLDPSKPFSAGVWGSELPTRYLENWGAITRTK